MTSLTDALYNLPAERLRALVRRRDIDPKRLALTPNKRQLARTLADEISRPHSLADAVFQCDARALRLLQILATLVDSQGVVPRADLVEAIGGPELEPALASTFDALEELGLAFRIQGGAFLPPSVVHSIPVSLSERYTLARVLAQFDAPTLKRVIQNLGLSPDRDTKGVMTQAIVDHLLHSGPGLRLNTHLDEEERAVLEFLVQNGGEATAVEVASAVVPHYTEDFFRWDWHNRWKQGKSRNAIDQLLGRALVHVVAHNYGFQLFLVIPGDLLRVLTGGSDSSFWTAPPPTPHPIETLSAGTARHDALLRDAVAFLSFVSASDVARTQTGHIHKTALKNAARLLSLPDERYAAFVYAVCRDAELLAPEGDRQIYALTRRGYAWLAASAADQRRALFEAWRGGLVWCEMYTDPLRRQGDYRPAETILEMRQAAIDLIADAARTPNTDAIATFYDLNSLAETLAFRQPLLLTASATMGPDLLPSPQAFLRALVAECLFWLGAAEVSPAPPEPKPALKSGEATQRSAVPEAEAFRLTPVGIVLFGLPATEQSAEPLEEQFVLQANGEVFVPPYLEPATLYRLLSLAETPGKNATTRAYALTRESVRRALDRGETPQQILDFLRAHSRTPVPQNVEYLINEVGSRHGHIRVGRAQMYLQTDSPLTLKELKARREFKEYFVRDLSDTVAILSADDPDKLLRELRKAGYLPTNDDAPSRPRLDTAPGRLKVEPAKMPADKRRRRAQQADTALDWNRIALEDGQSHKDLSKQTPPKTQRPTSAESNAVLDVITEATALRQRVRLGFQVPGGMIEELTLEPIAHTAHAVIGFSPERRAETEIPFRRITWAHLTGETFA